MQPEHNFYQISETVFRSEQPDQDLVQSLKAQEIDVIINLRSRNQDLKKLSNQGFELVHIPIHTWAIDREDLLKVMQQIQHAEQNQQKGFIALLPWFRPVPVPVWPCIALFSKTGLPLMPWLRRNMGVMVFIQFGKILNRYLSP